MNRNITSNSCVGSLIYNQINLPHQSPLVGSLFLDDFMYLKFLENYNEYINVRPELDEKYSKEHKLKEHIHVDNTYVLMKLHDIEIHWIHEHNAKELREKWTRRLMRSKNFERISIWTTSEFMQIHNDEERKELIDRFKSLPEFTLLLTEREDESIEEENHVTLYIPEWKDKKQDDRTPWGFLTWNDQLLQRNKITEYLKND